MILEHFTTKPKQVEVIFQQEKKKIAGNVRITMADKAMLTNPKSYLRPTKRPNVWLNIHTGNEHNILHKKKINRTRRRRENRNMKSRLIFTLCSSSSFCYVFPHFQFPFKTNFSATPSFLNVFS